MSRLWRRAVLVVTLPLALLVTIAVSLGGAARLAWETLRWNLGVEIADLKRLWREAGPAKADAWGAPLPFYEPAKKAEDTRWLNPPT